MQKYDEIEYKRYVPPKSTEFKLSTGIEETDKNPDGSPVARWRVVYAKMMLPWVCISYSFIVIQAVDIYVKKDSKNVSLPAYCVYLFSSCLWWIYGFFVLPRRNLIIVLSSTIAITVTIILLTGIIIYR